MINNDNYTIELRNGDTVTVSNALAYIDQEIQESFSVNEQEELLMDRTAIVTDLFVMDIRELVVDFYEKFREETLSPSYMEELVGQLNKRLNDFVHIQIDSFQLITDGKDPNALVYGPFILFGIILEELKLAADRFSVLMKSFQLRDVLSEYGLFMKVDIALPVFVKKSSRINRANQQWQEIVNLFQLKEESAILKKPVVDAMSQLAVDFFEERQNRITEHIFAEETILEMTDLFTDFLVENWNSNRNEVVTAFAGFHHLIDQLELAAYFDESLVEEVIYPNIADEEFVEYLEYIRWGEWDLAIKVNSDYAIPYYYKLYNLFSGATDLVQVNHIYGNNFPVINLYLEKIGDLFDLLQNACEYLPTIDTDVDLRDAFSEKKSYIEELEEKNKQLQDLIVKNRRMVDDFSHSWTNIMKPDIVYKAAQAIRNDDRYRDQYLALIRAYNDEVLATNECRMLKLTHSDASPESRKLLRNYMKEGIAPNKEKGVGISYIINYALSRTLFRVFYEKGNDRIEYICTRFMENGVDIEAKGRLFDMFVQESEDNNNQTLQWFNGDTDFFNIEIDMDEQWEKVSLYKNKGITTFLITRFMELFINAFTYGSKKKEDAIKIELTSTEIDFYDFLKLCFVNKVDSHKFTGGSKKGLEASKEILHMLNGDRLEEDNFDFLISKPGPDHSYSVELYLDQYLLITEED